MGLVRHSIITSQSDRMGVTTLVWGLINWNYFRGNETSTISYLCCVVNQAVLLHQIKFKNCLLRCSTLVYTQLSMSSFNAFLRAGLMRAQVCLSPGQCRQISCESALNLGGFDNVRGTYDSIAVGSSCSRRCCSIFDTCDDTTPTTPSVTTHSGKGYHWW